MKQSDILVRPYVTEKALNLMGGTAAQGYKDGNKIEFIVNRDADKADIKAAFEERFEVKVECVWTRIQLAEGYSAEDVGMRVGVF